MAAWYAVQLILTAFMKGFEHSVYVRISVSMQVVMQHLASPNSSLKAAFHC